MEEKVTTKKILALDTGFSDVKVTYLVDGKIKDYFKDLTLIYKLPTDEGSELKYTGKEKNVIKIGSEYYLLGGSALQLPDDDIVTIDSFEQLKEVTPILVNKYLAKYRDNVDTLVITISAAFIKQAQEYKQYVSEKAPFPLENILIVPQGPCCKVAIDNVGLDIDDPSHKIAMPSYLGIDIGFNTIDTFTVIDNSVVPAKTRGFESDGIVRIARKVQEYIKENHNRDFSISRIKQIIYDGKFTSRGETVVIKDVIEKEVIEYIKWLHDFLEKEFASVMNTISNVVILGGGAEVIRSQKNLWDMMYSKDFVKFPETAAEYFNAIGAAFIANK